jgi:hypothetical protein
MPRWLLICYRTPAEPSALRVATWRTLKQVGAVAVGGGVYAAPDSADMRDSLQQLSARICGGGGQAFLISGDILDPAHEQRLCAESEALRAEEYAQVVKSSRHFIDHVDREAATEDFRFAEVESLEEELEKVRRQLRRVVSRDHFESPTREDAQAAIVEAERRLLTYVEQAFDHTTGRTGPETSGGTP